MASEMILWYIRWQKPSICIGSFPLKEETFLNVQFSFFFLIIYEIFRLISERENPEESFSLEMSVCEIYNNEVRDLLAGKNASRVGFKMR